MNKIIMMIMIAALVSGCVVEAPKENDLDLNNNMTSKDGVFVQDYGRYIESIKIDGGYAYSLNTGADMNGFSVWDVSNPKDLKEVCFLQDNVILDHPADLSVMNMTDGKYVFISVFDTGRLTTINVTDPYNCEIINSIVGFPGTQALSCSNCDDRVLCAVATYQQLNRMKLVNVTDVLNQNVLSSVYPIWGGAQTRFTTDCKYVYANHLDGKKVSVIDITNRTNIRIVGEVDVPGFADTMCLHNDTIGITASTSGNTAWNIINYYDKTAPYVISSIVVNENFPLVDDDCSGDYFYGVTRTANKLYKIDITDLESPFIISQQKMGGNIGFFYFDGSNVFVSLIGNIGGEMMRSGIQVVKD